MQIFQADQDNEKDYGLRGYYNTESRTCIKKSETRKEKVYLRVKNPYDTLKSNIHEFNHLIKKSKRGKGVQHWEQQGSLGDE